MLRKTAQLFVVLVLLTPVIVYGQHARKPAAPKMTNAQKTAFAMRAGPPEIARHATIMDMTDMAKPKQLRAGTNGWVCYAMIFGTSMCLDKEWQKWAEAWMNKTEPKIEGTGIAYILRGSGASNTDPYATRPTADNQWVVSPPHLMVLYSDPKMLDAYPTDPKNGGPWVMWKGTPYAHLMVPVSTTKAATMSPK